MKVRERTLRSRKNQADEDKKELKQKEIQKKKRTNNTKRNKHNKKKKGNSNVTVNYPLWNTQRM